MFDVDKSFEEAAISFLPYHDNFQAILSTLKDDLLYDSYKPEYSSCPKLYISVIMGDEVLLKHFLERISKVEEKAAAASKLTDEVKQPIPSTFVAAENFLEALGENDYLIVMEALENSNNSIISDVKKFLTDKKCLSMKQLQAIKKIRIKEYESMTRIKLEKLRLDNIHNKVCEITKYLKDVDKYDKYSNKIIKVNKINLKSADGYKFYISTTRKNLLKVFDVAIENGMRVEFNGRVKYYTEQTDSYILNTAGLKIDLYVE